MRTRVIAVEGGWRVQLEGRGWFGRQKWSWLADDSGMFPAIFTSFGRAEYMASAYAKHPDGAVAEFGDAL